MSNWDTTLDSTRLFDGNALERHKSSVRHRVSVSGYVILELNSKSPSLGSLGTRIGGVLLPFASLPAPRPKLKSKTQPLAYPHQYQRFGLPVHRLWLPLMRIYILSPVIDSPPRLLDEPVQIVFQLKVSPVDACSCAVKLGVGVEIGRGAFRPGLSRVATTTVVPLAATAAFLSLLVASPGSRVGQRLLR
ncbi:hypothetical protein BN1723_004480 [Verticillium longisporum]|uniref:Uncharacterized protein n=1 Tax=Verticillium longisporum TaxID=100787 RepID=A0A0G4MX50_VERLO|nr:hypothetical protein BN1708_006418 [Verticillium longisporum]CRK38772.1 hypothetical protein BN1723_004480 [Verticillium longisporum]